jgi:hypothetical protein
MRSSKTPSTYPGLAAAWQRLQLPTMLWPDPLVAAHGCQALSCTRLQPAPCCQPALQAPLMQCGAALVRGHAARLWHRSLSPQSCRQALTRSVPGVYSARHTYRYSGYALDVYTSSLRAHQQPQEPRVGLGAEAHAIGRAPAARPAICLLNAQRAARPGPAQPSQQRWAAAGCPSAHRPP